MARVKIYGTTWCFQCHLALKFLKEQDIDFEWIDIDQSPEGERFVRQVNRGNRSVPTLLFEDGSTLTEPSRKDLADFFTDKD